MTNVTDNSVMCSANKTRLFRVPLTRNLHQFRRPTTLIASKSYTRCNFVVTSRTTVATCVLAFILDFEEYRTETIVNWFVILYRAWKLFYPEAHLRQKGPDKMMSHKKWSIGTCYCNQLNEYYESHYQPWIDGQTPNNYVYWSIKLSYESETAAWWISHETNNVCLKHTQLIKCYTATMLRNMIVQCCTHTAQK